MKICVIGGANVDITAASFSKFIPGDSNPGSVRISLGGVARNIAHNLVLLGDEVRFLTFFDSGDFGRMAAADCDRIGMDTSLSSTAFGDARSCFISLNDVDGEMIGGVADMSAVEGITPAWLEERLPALNEADAVVADANVSTESLSFLISHVNVPLYLDAVSGAKAVRLADALRLSGGPVHAVKCNVLEAGVLSGIPGCGRMYISRGADGIRILEDGVAEDIPALPARVVNVTGGGDALFAGIIHAGPSASASDAARFGLRCAKYAVESPDAVNPDVSLLMICK